MTVARDAILQQSTVEMVSNVMVSAIDIVEEMIVEINPKVLRAIATRRAPVYAALAQLLMAQILMTITSTVTTYVTLRVTLKLAPATGK